MALIKQSKDVSKKLFTESNSLVARAKPKRLWLPNYLTFQRVFDNFYVVQPGGTLVISSPLVCVNPFVVIASRHISLSLLNFFCSCSDEACWSWDLSVGERNEKVRLQPITSEESNYSSQPSSPPPPPPPCRFRNRAIKLLGYPSYHGLANIMHSLSCFCCFVVVSSFFF